MSRSIIAILTTVLLISYFQNCSDVHVSPPPVVEASQAPLGKLGARICPSLSNNGKNYGFNLRQVFVVNLTSLPVKDGLAIDSDMDGIADADEVKDGFKPANRRSFGMLDLICLKTGGAGGCVPKPGCIDAALSPGLTGCDLSNFKAANSIGQMTGLDTDNDDLPDFLEVLRGTNVIVADGGDDYDVDLQTNLDEISLGSDINSAVSQDSKNLVNFDQAETNETCNTRQKIFEININNIRLLPDTLAVVDDHPLVVGSQKIDLSHGAGENVLAVIYVSEPAATTVVKKEIYMQIMKVHSTESSGDFIIKESDFVFLGEVEP